MNDPVISMYTLQNIYQASTWFFFILYGVILFKVVLKFLTERYTMLLYVFLECAISPSKGVKLNVYSSGLDSPHLTADSVNDAAFQFPALFRPSLFLLTLCSSSPIVSAVEES